MEQNWNKIDKQIRNVNHRLKFKEMLRVFYLDTYKSLVICLKPRCQECNEVATYHSVLFHSYNMHKSC